MDKTYENHQFKFYKLNEKGIANCHKITRLFDKLLNGLKETCADGIEFYIVKQKLEEACFYAKKAGALKEEHQENFN